MERWVKLSGYGLIAGGVVIMTSGVCVELRHLETSLGWLLIFTIGFVIFAIGFPAIDLAGRL